MERLFRRKTSELQTRMFSVRLWKQEPIELEDMKRSRLISRVGTGVATIGG